MNSTTIANLGFISVCQFITNLGVILSNKSQITNDQRNQTLTPYNVLFQHINECNADMFAYSGNTSFSRNVRSSGNPFSHTPLAIAKIEDYVGLAEQSENVTDGNIQRRFRRQPLGSNDEKFANLNVNSDDLNIEPNDPVNDFDNIQSDLSDGSIIDLGDYDDIPRKIPKIDDTPVQDDLAFEKIPGTLRGAMSVPHRFLESKEYNFKKTLKVLRDKGLMSAKENKKDMERFRLDLKRLAVVQINEEWIKQPINLWYSETTKLNVIQFLANLTGKTFFFNDITLLKQTESKTLPWEIWRPFNFDTSANYKVYYYLTIDSPYGFIHLKSEDFQNLYITFSSTLFTVRRTEFLQSNRILIMEMDNKYIERSSWTDEIDDKLLPDEMEKNKNKRMQSIEKAAELVSSFVPMLTFDSAVEKLKGYLFKMESSTTPVPTYHQVAKEYCENLIIPEKYRKWMIPRHKLIDEVLFKTNIKKDYCAGDCEAKIYRCQYGKENWKTIKETYQNSFELQKRLSLLDFYTLRRFLYDNLMRESLKAEAVMAIYKLALRDCEEDSNAITLYQNEHFTEINIGYSEFSVSFITQKYFSLYSSNRTTEVLMSNILFSPRVFQLELENEAGIVSLDIIILNSTGQYLVPADWKFEFISNYSEIVNEESLLFMKMRNTLIKEEKMIHLINKFYKFLTNNSKTSDY